jgi:hypothetical protein
MQAPFGALLHAALAGSPAGSSLVMAMAFPHHALQENTAPEARAFSSEVDTGSREENASKQKIRARF